MDDRRMNPAVSALWLTLARLPGLGPSARVRLFERFGSIEALFDADRATLASALAELESVPTIRPDSAAALAALQAGPSAEALAPDLAWLAQDQHHLVTWADADYPPLLREIADPPVALYVHGRRDVVSCPQLAVVGSRNPTPLGVENAAAFARALAPAGLTITSGLALGIDGAAHRGALEAGGSTIAVAGTGLDRVYPARHRNLAHAIVAHGALVSEFPIGTPARAGNFPVRNRIISGMSVGVLVVEAALKSGSLITARLAAEQGREVFALPGSIHSPLARGCHALIREGAKLVETAAHVLEELGPLGETVRAASALIDPPSSLAPHETQLLGCLSDAPMHLDVLIERSGLTADIVSSILLQLELRGLVLAGPGGYQKAGGR
ncbi:MAG: DNA-processing protein DprA [Sulfurifustis sp.]